MVRRLLMRVPMSEAEAARWTRVRERGRDRYVLVSGVLGWGMPVALLGTIINGWLGAPGPFLGRLAIAVLVSSLSGVLYGRQIWSITEQRYHAWGGKA